ncbi:hypothetical protein AmaxDRAFT_4914, partial [Limnospira maxima CS-328]
MDEQRVQAYLSLIQELLECPTGEEPQILNRHLELVDEGFVQVCELVAAQLRQAGQDNLAQFLQNVAQRVETFLGLETAQPSQSEAQPSQSEMIPTEYETFLREALRLTSESGVNPSVVYPFLERQQAKLNEDLIALIPAFATRTNIIDLFNFANLVQQFPQGQRAINLEIAIAIYIKALDFFDRQDNPEVWGTIQNSLAVAYRNRLRGERAENIEEAIRCYQAALEVRTRTAYAEDWATTQNNLGNAYCDRIRGERADNIEEAIAALQAALKVYTRTAFPEDWARTQNNLGNAYSDRIRGERADNIEEAIACYRAALEVLTPSSFPLACLRPSRSLGNLGYDLQNWEIAIEGYNQAILAIEQSRYWATSEATKRELIANSLNIYQKMVQACINHQDYPQALLTVERSKSRTLIELLDSAHLYPKNATDEQKQRISDLRRQIAMYQQQLAYTSSNTLTPTTENNPNQPSPETLIRQQLQAANQQFQDLLTELDDPNFTLTQ